MNLPAEQSATRPRDGSVVLVFRALQVGDMLCAIPALRALRHRFPEATLMLVGLPWAHQLLPRYAMLIDRILPFPGHPELPEQAADLDVFDSFSSYLRTLGAELAIQLHGSGEVSNRIVGSFGAKRRLAFTRAEAHCKSPAYLRWPEQGHEVRRCLRLVGTLGASTADEALEFPLLDSDGMELASTGLPARLKGVAYVCMHAGARSASRRWPATCFATVADALAAAGFTVVLTGSGDEWPLAELVRRQMRYPALNAALPCSLGALAVLLSDARLLVCNDTGVSHLAAALRIPSVVIFSGSDPERWAPLDHHRHIAVVDREGVRMDDVVSSAMRQLAMRTAKH